MNTTIIKDVVVKIGGDSSELKKALDGSLGDLAKWSTASKIAGAAAGTAFAAVGVSLVALTRASLENADVLAKQARQLGVTVAAFQNMALVAEEAGVSAEGLTAQLGFMQRNLADLEKGSTAQVEAFRALGLTFKDLQGQSPDQQFERIATALDSVADPAQKTAAAMDIFGRGGREVILMLDDYSAALDNANQFNRTFGITLTETEAHGIESSNDAVGRLGLVMEGLGNRLAVLAAGPIEAAANAFIGLAEAIVGVKAATVELQNYQEILDQFGNTEPIVAMYGSWAEFVALVKEEGAIDSIERTQAAYDALYETVNRASSGMAADIEELRGVSESLAAGIQRLVDEADRLARELRNAISEGRIEDANRLREELGRVVEQLRLASEGAERLSGVDMSSAISWAESLAGAFWKVADAARSAASAAASIPGVDTGTGLSGADGNMPPSFDSGMSSSPRPKGAPALIDEKGTSGGGGGGGGTNPWEARLEALVGHLQTEEETIKASYDKNLETLKGALETELLTQAEYNEKMLQTQKDFRDAMREIDRAAFQEKADAWSGALGDLASLMQSGNKKLFNIGKVAAIAQASVDGWSAAVTAWDKGMKIGGPPTAAAFAAMSVIRTGVMIANIASQQFGGGATGGMGKGGGAQAPTAAAGPMGVSNIVIQGDVIGRNTGGALVQQINDAIKAGHRVNIEWQGAT